MSGDTSTKKITSESINCPICDSNSKKTLSLPFEYTKKKIEHICNAKFSSEVSYPNYDLFRCESCTLEFAFPLKAPSNQFYLWLTDQNFPYVTSRWEWHKAVSLLKETKRDTIETLRLVDIGCGTGNFLKIIKTELGFNAIGIDHNRDAIQQCINEGLSAYCGDTSRIETIFPKGANVITLWHILEHIDNPIQLLKSLRDRLTERGTILLSVPLSPMIAEALDLDSLNLPPHHLTRWNSKSLTTLSNKLEMEVKLYYPPSLSITHMLLKALIFSSNQGKLNLTKVVKLYLLIKFITLNIKSVFRIFNQLKSRQKSNSTHDIALLQLIKKAKA